MPRVPTYQPFQVQPTIGPGPAFQAPSGPGPAQIAGEQLQQMGQAVGKVGEELGRYAQIQQERINRARFYDVQSDLRELFRQEEQGLRQLKGAQLFDSDKPAFEQSREMLEQKRGEIINSLPNQVLRDAFQQEFSRQFEGFNDRMMVYEGEQFELYKSTTQDAAIEGAIRDAFINTNAREENFLMGINIVRDKVADAGLDGIAANEAAAEMVTSLVSDQIDELTRQGRFAEAIEILNSPSLIRGVDEIGILSPEGATGFGAIKEDDLTALRYGVNKAEASFQSIKLASNGDLSGANEVIDSYKDILSEPDIFALQTAASEQKISYDRRQAALGNSNDASLERGLVEIISQPNVTVDDVMPLVSLLNDPEKGLKWINAARTAESQRETGATRDLERASPVLRDDLRRQYQKRNLTENQVRDKALELYGSQLLTSSDYAGLLNDLRQDSEDRKQIFDRTISASFEQGMFSFDFDNQREIQEQQVFQEFNSAWSSLQSKSDSEINRFIQDLLVQRSEATLPMPPLPPGYPVTPSSEQVNARIRQIDQQIREDDQSGQTLLSEEERNRLIDLGSNLQDWQEYFERQQPRNVGTTTEETR